MARPLDTLRYHFGRLGRIGALGGLLLLASLAYTQLALHPLQAQTAAQLRDNARAAARADAARSEESSATASPQPALAPAAAAALRRLFEAAAQAGLDLDQGDYRLTEVGDAHLRRYQLALPVTGSYPQIRAFLAEAVNNDPALALVAVRLRRERIEATEIDAMLNFILYLASDA